MVYVRDKMHINHNEVFIQASSYYKYPFSLLFTVTITLFSITVIYYHILPLVLYKPLLLTCIPQLVL